jgi:hypothetical protein
MPGAIENSLYLINNNPVRFSDISKNGWVWTWT